MSHHNNYVKRKSQPFDPLVRRPMLTFGLSLGPKVALHLDKHDLSIKVRKRRFFGTAQGQP